ncbi:MAG: diguanylate cyclase, partial [Bacillota bacterium]|nr:diguanylate cyclase [Bacillota bacterium]
AFADGRISDYELELVNVDGTTITILLNATLYKDADGHSIGLFAAVHDVTTTRKYERELLVYKNNLEIQVERRTIELVNSQQYFELVFNTIPDATLIARRSDGKVLAVNDSFVEFFGYARSYAVGRTVLELNLYKQSSDYLRITNALLKRGYCVNEEIEFVRKDGSSFTGLLSIKGIVKDGVNCISSYIRDISERKQREAETIYMVDHDYLTGLYNRYYFERELIRMDRPENYPLTIMMADINGLKLINDAYGQAAGDEILREIAESIQACCGDAEVLARVGGDEFACILPHLDDAGAHQRLLDIQASCARIHEPYLDRVSYSNVSLGYAVKTSPDEEIKGIVKLAEDYMYRRKLLEHKSSRNAIIASIKATMAERNMETEEHAERLIVASKKIGTAIGLSAAEQDKLELLATLHDIGKVGVDDAILTKPGPLTNEEWVEMRKHPEIGYRIAISSAELVPIADMILYHHERWDGDGYPQRLKGDRIPLLSRIIAITDAFDAMTHDRPYRSAMNSRAAYDEITRCSNKQFDPTLVRIFLELNHIE